MSQMQESLQQSNSSKPVPEGRLLSVKPDLSGYTTVRLDNGIPHGINIITRSEDAHILLGSDLAAIRAHLMTRTPGHFRRKRKDHG